MKHFEHFDKELLYSGHLLVQGSFLGKVNVIAKRYALTNYARSFSHSQSGGPSSGFLEESPVIHSPARSPNSGPAKPKRSRGANRGWKRILLGNEYARLVQRYERLEQKYMPFCLFGDGYAAQRWLCSSGTHQRAIIWGPTK